MENILNEVYPKLDDNDQIEILSQELISHISQVLDLCINNKTGDINNEILLEMSYNIIQHDIGNVNETVKNKFIEFAKKYYNKYKAHSNICLGILKKYENFSKTLIEIENKNI